MRHPVSDGNHDPINITTAFVKSNRKICCILKYTKVQQKHHHDTQMWWQFQTDTNLYKYTIYSLCRTLQQDLSFDLDRDLQMLVDKKTVLESCVNNTKQNKTAYTDNV